MNYSKKAQRAASLLENEELLPIYLKFESYLSKLDGCLTITPHKHPNGQYTSLYDGTFFGILEMAHICMIDYEDLRTWFSLAPVNTKNLIPFANMSQRSKGFDTFIKDIEILKNESIGGIFFFLDESGNIWSAWDETVYKVSSSLDEFLLELNSGLARGYPESYDFCYD